MKGDFDRETFDPRKHYAGVLSQQGRVATAADWNEQGEIVRRRIRIEARDVIGPCGGPEDDCGFAITVSGKTLTIGAGRYYVDGILCENEQDGVPYEQQPDYPNPPDWLAGLGNTPYALAYLDVWGRHVTALDDPRLREVALGGPDTDTRLKRVWQVKILPLAVTGSTGDLAALQAKRASLAQKRAAAVAAGDTPTVQKLDAEIAELDAAIAEASSGPTCDSQFDEWDALVADPDRRLNARTTAPPPDQGPCIVPPAAGYRRLENQLYRVEVHHGSDTGAPTFKWSRDNGTVVTTIRKISGKEIDVDDLGPDDVLGFASGQWVELSDDALEFAGQPGQLAQIDSIDLGLRRISLLTAPAPLSATADGVNPALHPKLRRWDQADGATADGVAIGTGWIALEDGVEVQFSGSGFKSGDYWTIPARTATGEIEWPPFAIPNQNPEAQPPRGIRHHYCRLALLAFDPAIEGWTVVEDCRRPFPPLTDPTCCSATALHVVGINWENDGAYLGGDLEAEGLRITLDGPPDPACLTNDTVQVAVEVPYVVGDSSSPFRCVRIHLLGTVGTDPADPNVIVWKVAPDTRQLAGDVGDAIRAISSVASVAPAGRTRRARAAAAAAPRAETPRPTPRRLAYVTLKGHCIWRRSALPRSDASTGQPASGALVYLDGQAFARPGVQADNTTPRIDLVLPSGHGAKASDFESWFGPQRQQPAPSPLQVTTVRFLNANGSPSSAGDVTVPRTASDPKVQFKAGEQIVAVQVMFNRPFFPESLGTAATPSLFITLLGTAGPPVNLAADVVADSATTARLTLRQPAFIPKGAFRLTGLGTSPPGTSGLGLKAADDQSLLDGDYDNQPGGNFTLDFAAL
jgi:Family of unknown function (DUF6519)